MSASRLSSISVFAPCWNEAENMPAFVEQAASVLPTIAKQFEVIIVNDGSSDTTTKLVTHLQEVYPFLRLVSHETNKGYGASLRTGIKAARFDWIFWTDGDLQFHLDSLRAFVSHTAHHTAVIGYRRHRADTFIRKLNGELYTQLINALFHIGVRDIDCAFKLIPTHPLQELDITSSGAFTSAEILIRLHRAKIRFVQLPVTHYKRKFGTPTGGSMQVIFKGLRETIQFYCTQ